MRYQPFYCEENIWHLCQDPRFAARSPAAVFVSGASGGCVMWHQKAAPRPGAPLLWDYHVFLLARAPWEIWDPDTTLGLPVPAAAYLLHSFRPEILLPEGFEPQLRVVPADELARVFASDRSHMRTKHGRFQKPPPPWPPIGSAGEPSNLDRFIDMENRIAGEVLPLDVLVARVREEKS